MLKKAIAISAFAIVAGLLFAGKASAASRGGQMIPGGRGMLPMSPMMTGRFGGGCPGGNCLTAGRPFMGSPCQSGNCGQNQIPCGIYPCGSMIPCGVGPCASQQMPCNQGNCGGYPCPSGNYGMGNCMSGGCNLGKIF